MPLVRYTGTATKRVVTAEDFSKVGITQSDLVFPRNFPIELPDDVADYLVKTVGEFETGAVVADPTALPSPQVASGGSQSPLVPPPPVDPLGVPGPPVGGQLGDPGPQAPPNQGYTTVEN